MVEGVGNIVYIFNWRPIVFKKLIIIRLEHVIYNWKLFLISNLNLDEV